MVLGTVIKSGYASGLFTIDILSACFASSLDSCRTGSAVAIKELRSLSIKSVLLTSDNTATSAFAWNQLRRSLLAEVHSELLLENEVTIVDAKDGPMLMIGGGMRS